ncbi:hypothetical protein PHAVU_010G083600 [Phaseolus vulgaris]|uniref:S-protein homolog n=1 Tax=Phaseolus vulgaris TaxID=3885 RepID=V7AMM8_PHAVU|nr:hypothetical protein PHAVU_010G083600g [Phaseolus vulgaris]ESW06872.1 hypothetical protein PHAVU_010G083600g [Phaseolus vulgaris]
MKVLVTVVVGLMIMKMVQSEGDVDGILGGKKTVRVTNDMTNGISVFLHCKSRDDDLGARVLEIGQYQEWSFRNNIGHTTLFWCNLQARNVQNHFEAYSYKEDSAVCDQCYRSLKDDGLYFFNQYEKKWEKKAAWNIHAF